MSDLKSFIESADKRSAFLKFEEGVSVVGIYVDAQLIDDQFNPGQKTMQYTLEVDGVAKTFKSKSASLARQLAKIEPGTEVEITKSGNGFKTTWSAVKIKV